MKNPSAPSGSTGAATPDTSFKPTADASVATLGERAKELNRQRESDVHSLYELSFEEVHLLPAADLEGAGFLVEGGKTDSRDPEFVTIAAGLSAECGFYLFGDPPESDRALVRTMSRSLADTAKTVLAGDGTVFRVKVPAPKPDAPVVDSTGCGVAFERAGQVVVIEGRWND